MKKVKAKVKKDVQLNIRIPNSLKEKLEKQRAQISKENGLPLSLSSLVIAMIENYLNEM